MSKISLKHSGGNVVSLNSPTSAPTSADVAFKLPNADGTSGQAIVTDASGNLSFASTGKVLQVLQAVKTDTQSLASSATPVDITGLSITMTPASSSSKFYITGKVVLGETPQSQHMLHIDVNGTTVGQPSTSGSRALAHSGRAYMLNDGQYTVSPCPIDFLVDASNANAHTIKLQFSQPDVTSGTSKTIYVNRSRTDPDAQGSGSRFISTLTVMEVAA